MKEKTEAHDKAHEADKTSTRELAMNDMRERDNERVDDVGDDVGFASLGW